MQLEGGSMIFYLLTDEAGIHSSVVVMGEGVEDAAALHFVRLVE